jgi:hypothetical protein
LKLLCKGKSVSGGMKKNRDGIWDWGFKRLFWSFLGISHILEIKKTVKNSNFHPNNLPRNPPKIQY